MVCVAFDKWSCLENLQVQERRKGVEIEEHLFDWYYIVCSNFYKRKWINALVQIWILDILQGNEGMMYQFLSLFILQ